MKPMALVAVTRDPLDLQALSAEIAKEASGDGAVVGFSGLVRDHNQGRRVLFLEYEAYEPLAVRALELIVTEAREMWPDARLAMHHRIGRIEIGEASITSARPASVLPTPASMVFSRACGGIPSARPIARATSSKDRNGLSLRAVRKICSAIAAAMMRNVTIQRLP